MSEPDDERRGLDALFTAYVTLVNPAFERDARANLDTLVVVMSDALHTPSDISPGEENKSVAAIYKSAHELRSALNDGLDALKQSIGYRGQGRAYDIDGDEHRKLVFLRVFAGELETLLDMTQAAHIPTTNGRPESIQRVIAVARSAAYFKKWTGALPTSRTSPFAQFTSGIFELLKFRNADDLSAQIRKVVALKKRGVNLETWEG